MKKDGNISEILFEYLKQTKPFSAEELFITEIHHLSEVREIINWLNPILRDFDSLCEDDLVNELDVSRAHKFLDKRITTKSWFWGLRLLALVVAIRDEYELDELDLICALDFKDLVNSNEILNYRHELRVCTATVMKCMMVNWEAQKKEGFLSKVRDNVMIDLQCISLKDLMI